MKNWGPKRPSVTAHKFACFLAGKPRCHCGRCYTWAIANMIIHNNKCMVSWWNSWRHRRRLSVEVLWCAPTKRHAKSTLYESVNHSRLSTDEEPGSAVLSSGSRRWCIIEFCCLSCQCITTISIYISKIADENTTNISQIVSSPEFDGTKCRAMVMMR